jgi:hypothetical protein
MTSREYFLGTRLLGPEGQGQVSFVRRDFTMYTTARLRGQGLVPYVWRRFY